MSTLRIGLFGGGIVGGGVVELVNRNINSGRFNVLGVDIKVVKICVRDVDKARDFESKDAFFVSDIDDILNDHSINCIIEVMGGLTTAKDVVFGAINKGKHVVTANKALIAAFLPELQDALARNPSVRFCFEAAVCGGIPIINTLHNDFLGDRISKIMGIMNGTTNFMLCKMEDEGTSYTAALAEAQRLGFAEADPTADVEGHDVQAKIAILAKLSFGVTVPVEQIPTSGISKLGAIDFSYAKAHNYTIKLLGTAGLNADGSLAVYVTPSFVSLVPFSTAKGPGNLVVVNSDNLTQASFSGPGAGRYPTANSVLNDLIRLARGQCISPPFPLTASIPLNCDYSAKFYVRAKCHDKREDCLTLEHLMHGKFHLEAKFSRHDGEMSFMVITPLMKLSEVEVIVNELAAHQYILSPPAVLPLPN